MTPAGDPADERWYGENRTGHTASEKRSVGEVLQSEQGDRSEKLDAYLKNL